MYPAEVERVLQEHPGVAASAVLGRAGPAPRPARGRARAARPGAGAHDPGDLAAFVRERLARYKVPEEIVLVASLPRNAMGKVVNGELEAAVRAGA